MAEAVTYKNLLSEPRNNVIEILTNDVTDPISNGSRKWIYSRMPDVKAAGFKGYPIIIVHAVRFNPNERGSLGGKKRFAEWTLDVEIVTSDVGYGTSAGKGLEYLDDISDQIVEAFLDLTNRVTLKSRFLSFSTPVVSDVDTDTVHNELVYRRVITLSFRDRITLSA